MPVAVEALLRILEDRDRAEAPAHAFAAVVATRQGIPLLYTDGLTSMRNGRPTGPDTPFYLASQTKSYVGLLAARLHLEGIMPLDLTLDHIWPRLALPGGLRAGDVTMLHLLTHQLALTNDELAERTSYEEEVPAADYPALLAGSRARPPGFQYDNLGYLAYAAVLETITGVSWRDWIAHRICGPLGLSRTSARSSDFPSTELAWRNIREEGRWRSCPPKPDALMHAAGGLYSSPADLAKWIQANLSCRAGDLPPEVFQCAHRPIVRAEAEDGPFRWRDYALGLQLGTIGGVDVLGHRGGYAGARSLAVVAPAHHVGLAFAVNADFATRELLDRLAGAFFGALAKNGPIENSRPISV